MSDLGPIKPLTQPIAIKPLNRDDAKKDERKKKQDEKEKNSSESDSDGHINEYI